MKSMRVLILIPFLALILFVCGGVLNAQTNPDGPKFSLYIKALKPEVVLGADIDIEIKLTNTSTETLTFALGNRGDLPVGYKWEVRDESGAPIAKLGRQTIHLPNGQLQAPLQPPGSTIQGQVEPEKSILQGARISHAYPFDHSGKYTIQLSR